MPLKRRTILSGLVGFSIPLLAASCSSQSSQSSSSSTLPADRPSGPVRIGYQKATDLDLLRVRGDLDKRLKELGTTIEWALFPSGPPMLEAMNAGSLDFGGVGESPPIFSQAAGGEFYYVSVINLHPATQDIVVPKNSPIQSPADLKGKKIALQKGSSAHYLLLRVLQEHQLTIKDVDVVSLPPADARAAFSQGNVDAWSIWDPFLGVAQKDSNVRSLNVGRERTTFFLAAKQFAQARADLLKVVIAETKRNGDWAEQHTKDIAERFATAVNVDRTTLEKVYQRRGWIVKPIDDAVLKAQQEVADAFSTAQIIPKPIQVKEACLPKDEYTKLISS